VSKLTWGNLKKEYQDALLQAAKETQEYNRKAIDTADRKAYAALERAGVTILEPEDPEEWGKAMGPVYEKYSAQYLDLIEEVRQMNRFLNTAMRERKPPAWRYLTDWINPDSDCVQSCVS